VDKKQIREVIFNNLSSLSNKNKLSWNSSLTEQIIKFFKQNSLLHAGLGGVYLPMPNEAAPDFGKVQKELMLRLAYPIKSKALEMSFGLPNERIEGTVWLTSPHREVSPNWILVPGLAFTLKGERLGRGQGYFDRYLENYPGLKIGVSWSCQIHEQLPIEAHDCSMDFIITEKFCWSVIQQRSI